MNAPGLTTKEVAEMLGCTRRWVIALADSGRLPCERMPLSGRYVRFFDPAEVKRFAAGEEASGHTFDLRPPPLRPGGFTSYM